MRSPRIALTGCLVALACLALSGCIAEAREGPTPAETSTSPFASNDEALAAAVAAFQRYLDVSNDVGISGTTDPATLRTVAAGTAADTAIADAESLRDRGLRQSGPVRATMPIYNYGEIDAEGYVHVHAFVCLDLSSARLLDPSGSDVTASDRDDHLEYAIDFVSIDPASDNLILEKSDIWSYDGRC